MKAKLVTVALVISMMNFFIISRSTADDTAATTQSHEEHHPDAKDAAKEADQETSGHMDMSKMMESCKKKMKKGDCMKMMNQDKKPDKETKK